MGTDINQIAEKLHQSPELLSSIFNLNPDAIAITRVTDSLFIDCNQEFADQMGYSRDEIIGHTALELEMYTQQARKSFIEAIKQENHLYNYELALKKKNGEPVNIMFSARFIEVEGERVILKIGRDITHRRKREEEKQNLIEELDVLNEELRASNEELLTTNQKLRESTELYRMFFNSPLKGFMLGTVEFDDEGKPSDVIYQEINDTYEYFTGLNREDVMNRRMTDIIPPEEAQELIEIYGDVVLNGEGHHFEQHRPSLDKYYEIYAFPTQRNQFIANLIDVTSHKQAQKKALEAKKDWENTFYAVPDLIALINMDYTISRVNQALADRLNLKPEECEGKKCYELIHGTNEAPANCPHKLMMVDGQEHTVEVHDDKLNGYFVVSASPVLNEENNITGGVHVLRDITMRKEAELKMQEMFENEQALSEELKVSNEELQDITEELQASNEKLRSYQDNLEDAINKLEISNKELEQFAYVASHDLQEPLRMVSSFTQLLEKRYKDQLDEDADDFIGYIVEGAKRMKDLIDDLLIFSRLHTASRDFHPVNLNKVVNDVLVTIKPSIDNNNVQISSDALPTVAADSIQMGQLFQNLISNAIKFTDSAPEIHLSAKDSGENWLLGVSDHGIGIHPNHQAKIFDVFKRLHTRDEYEGTGIGLSICKRIVEIHDGDIWVESQPGKGSTFYFTLPKT